MRSASGHQPVPSEDSQEETSQLEVADVSTSHPLYDIGVGDDSPLTWSPDGQWLVFASGNYDINLARQDEREGMVTDVILQGHTRAIRALEFNPANPSELVSAAADGIRFWDIAQRRQTRILNSSTTQQFHEAEIECMLFVYDGNVFLTGSRDANIKIWNVHGGFRMWDTLYAHKAAVLCMSFCPATNTLATAGRDSVIKLWDASGLNVDLSQRSIEDSTTKVNLAGNLEGHRGDVSCLAWGQEGTIMFSGGKDNIIIVWDVTALAILRKITGHHGDVRRIFLLNQGKLLLSGANDTTVKLWELGEANPKKVTSDGAITLADVLGTEDRDEDAQVSRPTGSDFGFAGLEPVDKVVSSLNAHETDLTRFCVNPRFPFMATCSSYNCIRIWSIADLSNPRLLHEVVGHQKAVTEVAACHNGQHMLCCSLDFTLSLYHLQSHRRLASMDCRGSALCFAVTPDEKYVFAGGNDYAIKGFSLVPDTDKTFQKVTELAGHCGQVLSVAISNDGKMLASAAQDFTLKLWPLQGMREEISPVGSVEPHQGHCMAVRFSSHQGGGLLASAGADHTICVWKVNTDRGAISLLWRSPAGRGAGHASTVTCLAWGQGSTQNLLFSGGWDRCIKVWQCSEGGRVESVPIRTVVAHTARICGLSIHPNGQRLVSTACDHRTRVWDISNERIHCLVDLINKPHEAIPTSAFCDRDTVTVGMENGMLRVWSITGQAESGQRVAVVRASDVSLVTGVRQAIQMERVPPEQLPAAIPAQMVVDEPSVMLLSRSGELTPQIPAAALGEALPVAVEPLIDLSGGTVAPPTVPDA